MKRHYLPRFEASVGAAYYQLGQLSMAERHLLRAMKKLKSQTKEWLGCLKILRFISEDRIREKAKRDASAAQKRCFSDLATCRKTKGTGTCPRADCSGYKTKLRRSNQLLRQAQQERDRLKNSGGAALRDVRELRRRSNRLQKLVRTQSEASDDTSAGIGVASLGVVITAVGAGLLVHSGDIRHDVLRAQSEAAGGVIEDMTQEEAFDIQEEANTLDTAGWVSVGLGATTFLIGLIMAASNNADRDVAFSVDLQPEGASFVFAGGF
jgi:hypothetical protein